MMCSMTSEQIKKMDSAAFQGRLAELNAEFSRINQQLLVPLAKEIGLMKANCLHRNSEPRPYARWCNDCGEYYKVDTSFSPGI